MKVTHYEDTEDAIVPGFPRESFCKPFVSSSARVPLAALRRDGLRQHGWLTLAVLDVIMEDVSIDQWRLH